MDQFSFFSSPVAAALGFAVLYSVGQAFVIFICLRIILKFIPHSSSHVKYSLSYYAYLAIGSWFFITFIRQFIIAENNAVIQKAISGNAFRNIAFDNGSLGSTVFSLSFLNSYLPLVVAFYLLGIFWYSVRLSINFFETNRLRSRGLYELESEWKEHIVKLAERMKISRSLQTFFSNKINSPLMIGFFKPVILLPFTTINQLSAEQFEAILLHELAHIRRNDYLMNLIQTVLDTILFFNPFTWWITRNIRDEREKACDEMVLQSSDPFSYARALLALEEPLKNQPFIMTAVNKRSHLFHRIKNIMEMKNKQINLRQKFITLLVIAIATISVAWLSPDEGKLNKNQLQQNVNPVNYGASALQVFSFFPFNLLKDSIPAGLVPAPPVPPVPPAPAVAGPQEGIPPLPPAPGVPPVNPQGAPLPPQPQVPPLPPKLLGDTIPSGFFNSDEWKKAEDAMKKSTEEMKKYFQSDAWKKQQDLIRENAVAMKKYFDSPEWKKQQENFKKSGEEMKKYFNSPEWKKQQENFKKSGEEMKKYFNSPEWKKQQEQMKKHGEEMEKYFNSPEWKKQQEDLGHLTDSSLSAFFKSDAWQKQEENIQKAVAKTQEFFKSDEWKNTLESLQQLQLKLQKFQDDVNLNKK